MKTFIYRNELVPGIRERGFNAEDQKIIADHFQYLKDKLEIGELILAGPCEDQAFGIVIFRAESESKARLFMENDPAILRGLMTAELHAFKVSLIQ